VSDRQFRKVKYINSCKQNRGKWWRSSLRHCTTSREFAGSIPYAFTGLFSDIILYMALGSTQPLRIISTRNITWGKGNRCEGLTILLPSSSFAYIKHNGDVATTAYYLHVTNVSKSRSFNLLEPSRPVQPSTGIPLHAK
jgi:hypothetical protein